jgi:Xaa-Pro aminopeptidase
MSANTASSPIPERLRELRKVMADRNLDALIIPSNDPHAGEYVADYWQSRAWISGFTGSAGLVVVTADKAGLWTDSRYFLQGEQQLAGTGIDLHRSGNPGVKGHIEWILQEFGPGHHVGIDGKLISENGFSKLLEELNTKAIHLVTEFDPIDEIWKDRPPLPLNQIYEHDIKYAGKSRAEKLAQVRKIMAESGAENHFLSTLDDIAWLFNLRGSDVDFNPVFYAFALIQQNTASLFIDKAKVSEALRIRLKADRIEVLSPGSLPQMLYALDGSSLLYDPQTTVYALSAAIPDGCKCIKKSAPATLLKSIKNETEVGHIRQTMVKDGVALLRLYRWLEAEIGSRKVTEAGVAEKLAAFRAEQEGYMDESFPAIAGYKGNGAIVHYRPEHGSSATLKEEGIFLLDSGGQYLDGTTDITRTIALSPPTDGQKRDYTLVLKGHIALARARFPEGKSGYHLDTLARMHLWQHGLDYGHGTGHGVGFFLNVHEGPQGIRGNHVGNAITEFRPGMFSSNEPGYYKDGEYGIRIENLILCVEAGEYASGKFLEFETLTLFPIDTALIARDMLDAEERKWLNDYHAEVLKKLSPKLNAEEKSWLVGKCLAV